MECDKCQGRGYIHKPKPPITEYTHSWVDDEGRWYIYREPTLKDMIEELNKTKAPPVGIKNWRGETNWICLGIRREGSGAIVDTKYIYCNKRGKW